MPYTYETIDVASEYGVTIRNNLLLNETRTGRLLVMLPGRGYTNDHPVMHYLAKAAMAHDYDVLAIEYGFQVARDRSNLEPEKISIVVRESQQAIEQVLARGGYTHLCIGAKSLGTPMATVLMPNFTVPSKSFLLLTPIQNAAAMVGGVRTLAIIGTADASYDAAKAVDKEVCRWLVLDGLNHSLEKGSDWQASLDALVEITAACAAFLKV
jgi:predicted alpha/beta-hydrolase family hydrolase